MQRDNRLLTKRLERAEAIIELQKKLALLLGLPTVNDEESDGRRGGAAPRGGRSPRLHSAGACRAPACIAAGRKETAAAATRARPKPLRALTCVEQQRILDLLRGPRFVDLAPAEIYACLLDEGSICDLL